MIERTLFLASFLLFLSFSGACHSHPHEQEQEDETIAVTLWINSFELFMEYPPLKVGESARFAAHLTNLNTFEPVVRGPVTFQFRSADRVVKEVTVEEPLLPGIFAFEVSFDHPATLILDVIVDDISQTGTIRPSPIQIYKADDEIPPIEEVLVQGDRVAYSKEQQWKLPFRTEVASRHTLRESVSLSGKVLARPGGDFRVVPPLAGRFIAPASGPPVLGQSVRRGELLGWIEPPLSAPVEVAMESARVQTELSLAQFKGEITGARAQVVQRNTELDLARKEKERAERLFGIEAVSQRRLEMAQSALAITEANVEASQESLLMLLKAQKRLEGGEERDGMAEHKFPLYAPGSGTVAESRAAAGAFAGQQETLLRIVDLSRVWIRAEVHETDLSDVRDVTGARVVLPDGTTLEVSRGRDRLLLKGDVVDPDTRTFPIVWEVANSDRKLKVGLLLEIQVLTTEEVGTIAVPSSSVLREENKSIVYVQVAGETLDRRIVETGLQDGELIQIRAGLSLGDRVVVDGGYEVGLAALSTYGAGEGHVH